MFKAVLLLAAFVSQMGRFEFGLFCSADPVPYIEDSDIDIYPAIIHQGAWVNITIVAKNLGTIAESGLFFVT